MYSIMYTECVMFRIKENRPLYHHHSFTRNFSICCMYRSWANLFVFI